MQVMQRTTGAMNWRLWLRKDQTYQEMRAMMPLKEVGYLIKNATNYTNFTKLLFIKYGLSFFICVIYCSSDLSLEQIILLIE
jgi:hypothetical protein